MATSPVWHPTLGYGGNGNWTKRDARGRRARGKYDGCLQDGPFMDYPLHLGFGAKTEYNPRCLKRDFDLNMMEKSSSFKNVIAPILSATSYDAFQTLEVPSQARNAPLGPHSLGHLGVGGEVSKSPERVKPAALWTHILSQMANLFSSTGDPLFWIHHGGIDKLWYVWQKKNETHFNDVVASTVPYGRVKGAKMLTSLNSEIGMGVQAPSMPIKALIDPLNRDGTGILCYKYD